jgi:hypothetical protein
MAENKNSLPCFCRACKGFFNKSGHLAGNLQNLEFRLVGTIGEWNEEIDN